MFSLGRSDLFLYFLLKSRVSENIRTQHSTHMQIIVDVLHIRLSKAHITHTFKRLLLN